MSLRAISILAETLLMDRSAQQVRHRMHFLGCAQTHDVRAHGVGNESRPERARARAALPPALPAAARGLMPELHLLAEDCEWGYILFIGISTLCLTIIASCGYHSP